MHLCRAGYYGLINHVDNQISRLLQYMRDARLLDKTLIIVMSDHGEMLGDHNLFALTCPYEGVTRVPYALRAPKRWGYPREVVVDRPIGVQDVMPTLLDAAGVPIPETITGRSVLPLARGEDAPWRDAIHDEHDGAYRYDEGMQYLTDGHTKYVWYTQTGRELLFDLDADPTELRDLARRDGAEVKLAPWRGRLVERLRDRPEGFVSGDRLIVGRPHGPVVSAR